MVDYSEKTVLTALVRAGWLCESLPSRNAACALLLSLPVSVGFCQSHEVIAVCDPSSRSNNTLSA
jgi:hypothetical protein